MKKVLVLMSTYNGHKYIAEQIDSILSQKGVCVHLLIRDDGSVDTTLDIIRSYLEQHSNITLISGDNLGFAQSFMSLVYEAEKYKDYDYYAFSDQDDIWLDDKLVSGVLMLEPYDHSFPLLYFSNTIAVDENMHPLFNTHQPVVTITKESSLVRYLMLGCTMIMSRQTICFLSLHRSCYPILMHDLWINQTCAFFGHIIYDSQPHILYRQHGNNTAGVSFSLGTRIKRFIKSFSSYERRHFREYNAKNFRDTYSNILNEDDIRLLSEIADYKKSIKNRFRLLVSKKYSMGNILSDIMLKIRVLVGCL